MDKKRMMHELPVEAYTSQEWFDLEQKYIFSRTWQFAGLVEDVKDPGDYIAVQVGLHNIFIIKGRDHRLRAFHNMCRHRGTQLLRAVGKTKHAITCPYHDWTYDLEGNLISIPQKEKEFPSLKKELHKCDLNLHEASIDIFKGMLFVHPDKDASSIMDFFGPISPYLGPHIPEELIEYSDKRPMVIEEIRANWKIVAENFMDHYHLFYLHEKTLNMYDHARAEFGWVGPHYWFYEPLEKEYEANLEKFCPYVPIKAVPKDKIGAYVPWLFPNIGLSETEGGWSTFHVKPLAPDRTLVIIRAKGEYESDWQAAKRYMNSGNSEYWNRHGNQGKYDNDPKTDPMSSGDFMAEDIYACEQQQKSLYSPKFSIGARAIYGEESIRRFQEEVKKWIEKQQQNDRIS